MEDDAVVDLALNDFCVPFSVSDAVGAFAATSDVACCSSSASPVPVTSPSPIADFSQLQMGSRGGWSVADVPPLPPLTSCHRPLPQRPPQRDTVQIHCIFIRGRTHKVPSRKGPKSSSVDAKWLEFCLELARGGQCYRFPLVTVGTDEDAQPAATGLAKGICGRDCTVTFVNKGRHCMATGDTIRYMVCFVNGRSQPIRKMGSLSSLPRWAWAVESQMLGHSQMGDPVVFGKPLAMVARELHALLPVKFQFASKTPPLVLYHGTAYENVHSIQTKGLLVSHKPGMMGHGVYLCRWDRAVGFARQDAMFVDRARPGAVFRCLVFCDGAEDVVTASAEYTCTCGCGHHGYVDHVGALAKSRKARVAFVPDNAEGATKRAEWCVYDPAIVFPCDAVEVS